MQMDTHVTGGLLASEVLMTGAVLGGFLPETSLLNPMVHGPALLAGTVGAVIPDFDEPKSAPSRLFWFLAWPFWSMDHRGFTHTIPFAVLLSSVLGWGLMSLEIVSSTVSLFWTACFLTGMIFGHDLLDAMNGIKRHNRYIGGVPLWGPFTWETVQIRLPFINPIHVQKEATSGELAVRYSLGCLFFLVGALNVIHLDESIVRSTPMLEAYIPISPIQYLSG